MAKRFTDSEKWRKPWFRSLSSDAKLVWNYLTDNCDHAGIWPAAFDLMSSDVGFVVTERELAHWFGEKLIRISDEKFFIPGYIEFQYGELSEESKPHISVIKILIKYGIDPKNLTLSKGYPKGIRTIKDKDKNKDKENVLGECEGKTLEALYAGYPRKKGKSAGMKTLKAALKRGESIDDMFTSRDRFIENHRIAKTEAEFVPYFSTWASSYRDCLDPDYGSTESFGESTTRLRPMDEILAEQAAKKAAEEAS